MIQRNKNFKTVEGAIYKTKRKVKRRIRMNRVRGNVPILLFLLRINISYIRQSIAFLRKRAARVTDLGALLLWWMLSNGKWLVADVDDRRCHITPDKAGQIWKRKFLFEKNPDRQIALLLRPRRFRKAMFTKCSLSTLKRKAGLFEFLHFEKRFRKTPFSRRISVDGRPARSL